ncbi:hypothetical protein ANN_21587 [Periplaneta americana]|uniref:Uncharacterized protein n=1 Tax=Periplaneta americana TaxID=6978 RepID=A0ABQ8S5U7_PERAM|nr:hypothetical protein ANN_21587 [Periplaneta americana]
MNLRLRYSSEESSCDWLIFEAFFTVIGRKHDAVTNQDGDFIATNQKFLFQVAAPCKAGLNNFKEKLFRGRVSIPEPYTGAFKESTTSGFRIDPTVRFETNEEQPAKVDKEKKNIYNPTIPYYLQKYQLEELEVIGLLVGATGFLVILEEQRLRVFENKVLRKIFGAKRDEVTREWGKLHNAELHALYSSPDIIRNIKSRRLRWAGHVARIGEFRNAYRVLVGWPEGKRPLGRPRCRWEDNIKMDLREVGCDDIEWIGLAQDRDQCWAYVRAAMNLGFLKAIFNKYIPPQILVYIRPAQGLRSPSRLTAHERNADISCALYKGGLEEGVISYKMCTKVLVRVFMK